MTSVYHTAPDKLFMDQNGCHQYLHFLCVRMCLNKYTSCMKVGSGGDFGLVENTLRNNLGLCFIHGVIVL